MAAEEDTKNGGLGGMDGGDWLALAKPAAVSCRLSAFPCTVQRVGWGRRSLVEEENDAGVEVHKGF